MFKLKIESLSAKPIPGLLSTVIDHTQVFCSILQDFETLRTLITL